MKPKTTTQRSPSPADGNGNGPSLNFFRLVPPELAERPPLASSLQNFEQTLELISLRRFPGALAFVQAQGQQGEDGVVDAVRV